MAITTYSMERTTPEEGTITARQRINFSSADASGCEEIVAAPGAGYELLLQRLTLTVGGAVTVDIGSGEKSNACEKVLLGPLAGSAMPVSLDFGHEPIVLDPNKSLTVDASGAGVVWGVAEVLTRVCVSAGISSTSPSSSVSSSVSSSPSSSAS